MNTKIELTEEAKKVLSDLETLPQRALQGIARAMDKENQETVSHIQQAYESFPSDGPAVPIGVRHISGSMKRGTRASAAVIIGDRVQSSIGAYATNRGVNYAAVQEFGATIPPHKITAKGGGTLRFQIGERVMFRKSVNHPGATLPAREPMQRGIRDRQNEYASSISAAVIEAWKPR
jgi:hypothetical protein